MQLSINTRFGVATLTHPALSDPRASSQKAPKFSNSMTNEQITLVASARYQSYLMKLITTIWMSIFPVLSMGQVTPQYPVIFVHGINSSAATFRQMIYSFDITGDMTGGRLYAWKNSPGPSNCSWSGSWSESYQSWTPVAAVGVPASKRFFAIDFTDNNDLSFYDQGIELKQVIDCVKTITGQSKVILVAHSMGGLAARNYLQGIIPARFENDVAELITIGTPHAGSVTLADKCRSSVGAAISNPIDYWLNLGCWHQAVSELAPGSSTLNYMNGYASISKLPINVKYKSIIANGFGTKPPAFYLYSDGIVPTDSQSLLDVAWKAGFDISPYHSKSTFILNTCQYPIPHMCETGDTSIINNIRSEIDTTKIPQKISAYTGQYSNITTDGATLNGIGYIEGLTSANLQFIWGNSPDNLIYSTPPTPTYVPGEIKYQAILHGQSAGKIYYRSKVSASGIADAIGNLDFFEVPVTTSAYLAQPSLLQPINGAVDQPERPVMSWSQVQNAGSYRLFVALNMTDLPTDPSTSACPACILNISTGGTSIQISGGNFVSGKSYYWSVRAENLDQSGYLSTPSKFTIVNSSLLPSPLLDQPINGATQTGATASLSWQPVAGATSYRVVVARDAATLNLQPTDLICQNCLVNTTVSGAGGTLSLDSTLLAPGNTYFWRVKARNASQYGYYSEIRRFSIAQSQCSYAISQSSIAALALGGSYNIDISSQPNCSTTVLSNQTYCSTTTPTILADSSGQASISITVQPNGSTARNCIITIGDAALNVNQSSSAPPVFYSFGLNQATGGTASLSPAGTSFGANTTLYLTATPSPGYVFSGWMDSGTIVSAGANWAFPLTGNRTITPIFSSTQISSIGSISPYYSPDQKWRIVGNNINKNIWQKNGESIGLQSGAAYRLDCADTPYYLPSVPTSTIVASGSFGCSYTAKAIQPLSPVLTLRPQSRLASGVYNSLARLDDGRAVVWGTSQLTDFPNYNASTIQASFSDNLLRPLLLPNSQDVAGVSIGAGQINGMFTVSSSGVWKRWANAAAASIRVPSTDVSLNGFVKIVQNFGLKSDGSIWFIGQTGVNYPVATLMDIVDIAGTNSGNPAIALRKDGAVISLTDVGTSIGCMKHGISTFANCSYANDVAPVALPDVARVISIAAASDNAYGVSDDGRVWVWGPGTLTGGVVRDANDYRPVQIPGIADAQQVVASSSYQTGTVYVRTKAGQVYAWGANSVGQLGRGTTSTSEPVPQIISGLNNVVELGQTDGLSLLALDSSGFVWTVGVAVSVGNGSAVATQATPVMVSCPNGYQGNLNLTAFAANCLSATTNTLSISDLSPTLGKVVQVNGTPVSLPYSQGFANDAQVTVEVVPNLGIAFGSYRGDLYEYQSRVRTLTLNRDWNIGVQMRDCSSNPVTSATVVNGTSLPPITVGSAGGPQTVTVYGDFTNSINQCHWGFYTTDAWLHGNADGIGPGTFSIDISPNPTSSSRVGNFKVGGPNGGSVQVTQAAAAADAVPDPFFFTSIIGAPTSTMVQSSPIVVSGLNSPAAISVAGGEYSLGCSGTYGATAATVSNGQSVCVRHTTAASVVSTTTTTLTIGGVSGTFSSTTAAGLPGVATSVSAAPGDGQATVSFGVPASNGGSAITGYIAKASPGGQSASAMSSPIVVSGLSNGTAYSFTITTTTASGTSSVSGPSNSVVPVAGQVIGPISFSPSTLTVNATSIISAAGGASGQPVIFNSTTPTICSVTGNTVNGLAVGTCVISANQAGNAGYSAALQVIQSIVVGAEIKTINFKSGWNLVGNSFGDPIDVLKDLNRLGEAISVWKWIRDPSIAANDSKWAFFTPNNGTTITDNGAAYAAANGYIPLTSVASGEGFWVFANVPFSIASPAGLPVVSTSMRSLPSGWSLISVGDVSTPSRFNLDLSNPPSPVGTVPLNLISLWVWDNTLGKWYFYSAGLEASGGTALIDHITNKGYRDFTQDGKTLLPNLGFWVNRP